jgi:hypothetical protein
LGGVGLRWIFGQIGKVLISLFRPAIERVQAPKIPRRKCELVALSNSRDTSAAGNISAGTI